MLNAHGLDLTDEAIKAIAANCPSLAELYLSNCDVTAEAIEAIANNCPALTVADVSGCKNLPNDALLPIAVNYPAITWY